MIKNLDKQNIISNFPNIKLSYENITHKKVYDANIVLAIPDGNKYFAWFTSYKAILISYNLLMPNIINSGRGLTSFTY